MKGKQRSVEEKVRILRKADGEQTVQQVCDEHNISEQTFYRWKKEIGLLDVKQAKRLKELEAENRRVKKIGAEPAIPTPACPNPQPIPMPFRPEMPQEMNPPSLNRPPPHHYPSTMS